MRDDDSFGIDEVPWNLLAVRNPLTTSSLLVKRALLSKVGPFDQALRGPEDHDMWLRISELEPIGTLKAPLTGYRNVQGSLSKQAAQMERGMLRILEKIDERGGWNGKSMLRRSAEGYVLSSCAYLYAQQGESATGIQRLLKSLVVYPFPYSPTVRSGRLVRLKLASALCFDALGLR